MEICIKWNVCRICLEEENGSPEMLPIYEDAKLAAQIFDCSGIELKPSDNLPEKICKKCLLTLKYALKFRTTCRKSTEYLQSILSKTQSASSIFKSAKTTEDEVPFESIDFLDDEQQIEVENLAESGEMQYIIEDVDVQQIEGTSTKVTEPDEVQDSEEIIFMSEHDIKQEIDDMEEEEETQSQAEQIDEYILNDDSMTRTSEEDQKDTLRKYIKRETFKNPVEFICDVCGNHFQKRCLLNFHMKIHRNERNYVCEICNKRFNSPCNLRSHIRTHTGEKPFHCQYCERKFADRSTQIKHERIHTNEKPYTCSTCGKCFSLSTSLKAHEKMHTGEKPYKCVPCSKAFTLPHQLKAHLMTNMHRVLVELEQ